MWGLRVYKPSTASLFYFTFCIIHLGITLPEVRKSILKFAVRHITHLASLPSHCPFLVLTVNLCRIARNSTGFALKNNVTLPCHAHTQSRLHRHAGGAGKIRLCEAGRGAGH